MARDADFEREALALSLGRRETYVEVYEVDTVRRALLMERLGPSLAELRLSVEAQIDIIASTLRGSWRPVEGATELLLVPSDEHGDRCRRPIDVGVGLHRARLNRFAVCAPG